MTSTPLKRRDFLGATAASALALGTVPASRVRASETDTFAYEITRTDEEWKERLNPKEFKILREGDTELPKTSTLWNETRAGTYCCKGCDLLVYESIWKEDLNIGWAFFAQSVPDTILMGIDGGSPYGSMGSSDDGRPPALIEAHCRRCGSHLGHILTVKGKTLHCINGQALTFQAAAA